MNPFLPQTFAEDQLYNWLWPSYRQCRGEIHTVSAHRSSHPGRCEGDQTSEALLDCSSLGLRDVVNPVDPEERKVSKLKHGNAKGFPVTDDFEV